MSRSPLQLMAAAVGALVLTACTSTGGSPTTTAAAPSPGVASSVPTFVCTPEAGGSPTPCSEAEHAEAVKRDALYAEAEAVMKKFSDADNELARTGGTIPPDIDSLVTKRFKIKVEDAAKATRDSKTRVTNGFFTLSYLGRAPGVSANGSEVALHVCIDTRTATWTGPSGSQPGRGIHPSTTFFVREAGALKIDSQSAWTEPTC